MSRTNRKQILEVLHTLKKANSLLDRLMSNQSQEAVFSLLTECQNCAMEIGNQIESIWTENTKPIFVLEEYCEMLYQLSVSTNEQAQWEANYQKASRLLEEFERVFTGEIPDKLEVVFLPYKASMWDSLESVWRAAKEDADCDAYVIPIPYYDKNPNGSFREEHYEGNLYPSYVPITKYDTYDFEKRRPDVIFIHNPYDAGNYVTSVHPFFYSDNLKKYTEKLVYIPYFVLGEIDADNNREVETMERFCLTAGVLNADKVVVQSPNIRRAYIKALLNNLGNEEEKRTYWEDKILPTGSPKIDKVQEVEQDNLQIPEEWLEKIQRSDGTWKTVILYNTGIGGLLKNSEQMLSKIQRVFTYFEDQREEMVLLWRPHPLIKATIESMRPQLWRDYCVLVEKYQKEGWGIYDDTPELDRAIALCDAYYGDSSSVVQLCRAAGKLAMVQNVDL